MLSYSVEIKVGCEGTGGREGWRRVLCIGEGAR